MVSAVPDSTFSDGGRNIETRAACRLPQDILVNVLRFLSPTPLDLLRLGASSRVRRDPLALAAQERSLWSYYAPAYSKSSQQLRDPATQFVARLDNKPKQVRSSILNHYDNFAQVRAPGDTYRQDFSAEVSVETQDTDLICARFACLHLTRVSEKSCTEKGRSEESCSGWDRDDEEVNRNFLQWRQATPEFFCDLALMKMASRSCSEVALTASDEVLNDPTFLREYVLKPSCSGCDREGSVPLPFPLHRLSKQNLADKDLIRTALTFRPHSYNNLPANRRDDSADFLLALGLFEQRWPFRGDAFIPKAEKGAPPCLYAGDHNYGYFSYYPPCNNRWLFEADQLAMERTVELSPGAYEFLPDSYTQRPDVARRFLIHVMAGCWAEGSFDFQYLFPRSVRADASVMTLAIATPPFKFHHLAWVSDALALDDCFVAWCLAMWPEKSRADILRTIGTSYRTERL